MNTNCYTEQAQKVIECWTSAQLTLHVFDDAFSQPTKAFLNGEYLGPIVSGNITSQLIECTGPVHRNKTILTFNWGTIETCQYYIVTSSSVSDTVKPQLTVHGHDVLLNNRLLLWHNKQESTKLLINKSAVSEGVLGPSDLKSSTEYMVYVEGKRWPAVKHGSVKLAEDEAKRLLDLEPDKNVHVLSHHCTYKYVRKLVRSE